MNSNNKLSLEMIQDDLEGLSKKLYLESPDLWMDFLDKTGSNKFDEMVLFFSVKYNYPNIIKYVMDNDLIDFDKQSKNNSFSSIRNHLLSIANNETIKQYLLGNNEYIDDNTISENINTDENITDYTPEFNCPNCNSNIFNSGYIVSEKTIYKFSKDTKKSMPISHETLDNVSCVNCGHNITSINHTKLENLCTIESCSSCGENLINVGILDKAEMKFDTNLNKFIKQDTTYHCSKCNKKLNKLQLEHFSL